MGTAVESMPKTKAKRAELRDGTTVLIRPIQPADKSLLTQALAQMSERARYHRFAMVVRELSEEQLRYLTEIDHENHVAWIAIDDSEPVQRAVGVARYIRLDDQSDIAEVAVAVADSHKGRGIGTMLLARLARSAKKNGVHRFLAFVCSDNASVLNLVREVGARARFLGSGMYRVSGALPANLDGFFESSW